MTLLLCAVAIAAGCGDGDESHESAAGCAGGAPVEGRALRVATTVAPLTDIVATVADGSGTVVTGIVPEGVDSHTYEPAASVAAVLEDADVVFLNGLSLEEAKVQLRELAAAGGDGDAPVKALVEFIDASQRGIIR